MPTRMTRPRILFGDHRTQMPAIERLIDHDRFDVRFAAFDDVDFAPFDLVVPLRIDQIDPARAANADGRRRAVLPTPELVEQCDDKLLFNERLAALGFGDALPALLPDPTDRYPHIVKARRGDFGQGIRLVRGPEDDVALPPDSFRQEAVEGALEYVLHLLRVDGRVCYYLCYVYDMAAPLSVRGEVDAARSIEPADPERAMATCGRVLDALGYEGTCCFNYKLVDGNPRFLELNPRFGGSLVGDVTNYVAAHLDALSGR
jgi:carbamoylphosphate synthase large subunit